MEKICRLSELLHYDTQEIKHGELPKGLKEYRLLMKATLEAFQYFEAGDLEKFDSLVGENACQIRTFRLINISLKKSINFNCLYEKVQSCLQKIEELLNSSAQLMHKGVNLKSLLESSGLEIDLTSDEIFIVEAYLLTVMKEKEEAEEFMSSILAIEKSTPNKLKRLDHDISSRFLSNLANRVRKRLSIESVDYVRKAASSLKNKNFIRMVSDNFTIVHSGRLLSIPMFWTYKILLTQAHIQEIPIVIHIKFLEEDEKGFKVLDEEVLLFQAVGYGCGRYQETQVSQADLEKPACFIQGVACLWKGIDAREKWEKAIREYHLIDMILAGAADHRQYPDRNQELATRCPELEGYKQLAQQGGFSMENPSTFFIQHVYAAKVGKIVNLKRDA